MDLVLESSGARHGRGVLTRPDGSSYSGQFEYGVVESSGAFYGWAHEDHDWWDWWDFVWIYSIVVGQKIELCARVFQGISGIIKGFPSISISQRCDSGIAMMGSLEEVHGYAIWILPTGAKYEGQPQP